MDPELVARTFITAWNVDDDEKRIALLNTCCEPDARFVSPQGDTSGLDAFSASIGGFRRAFPRAVVVAGNSDVHHSFARFRWETRWNDGREPLYGDDFLVFGPQGRIKLLVSFDGHPAAPAK